MIESALLMESIDTQQHQIREPPQVNRVQGHTATNQSHRNRLNVKTKPALNPKTQCLRCGNSKHEPEQRCQASGVECKTCGGLNHFYKVCLKVGNATLLKGKHVNNMKRSSSPSNVSINSYSDIDNIQNIKVGTKVMISVKLNNHKVAMLYDPGAVSSIIGEELWNEIGSPSLSPTPNLSAYTGVSIETLGETSVRVTAFNSTRKLELVVVRKNDLPLFG